MLDMGVCPLIGDCLGDQRCDAKMDRRVSHIVIASATTNGGNMTRCHLSIILNKHICWPTQKMHSWRDPQLACQA